MNLEGKLNYSIQMNQNIILKLASENESHIKINLLDTNELYYRIKLVGVNESCQCI